MDSGTKQSAEKRYATTSQPSKKGEVDEITDLRQKLNDKFSLEAIKFHDGPNGLGNLEYMIASDDEDLAEQTVRSLLIPPEERATLFLDAMKTMLFQNWDPRLPLRFFLKHTLQSRLGTHCIFGMRYRGFELDQHSFVVHLDKSSRVVMLAGTYLPTLPEILRDKKPEEIGPLSEQESKEETERIRQQVEQIAEYDRANSEKLWLLIWKDQPPEYEIVPGNQVKLGIPAGHAGATTPPSVLQIPTKGDLPVQKIYNSPGLPYEQIGLGEIIREFLDQDDNTLSILADDQIKRYECILKDLDSSLELRGRYAAVRDQINVYIQDTNGAFVNQSESAFDRVNAYYHLDFIQRHFREKLGFTFLDDWEHLNPLQIRFDSRGNSVARYDVNSGTIIFCALGPTKYTAVRDPRLVYHEYVHAVTDAIARLHRAGRLITPRAKEALQAQAMDEGLGDYFASSLAQSQGARKALAYYLKREEKWGIVRDLDPDTDAGPQEPIQVSGLVDEGKWSKGKYRLGELWGRYLWQVRKSLGAEIADMLIAHSIFFLTRWATFEQGVQALLLADRLLFGGRHREAIEKPKEVTATIQLT